MDNFFSKFKNGNKKYKIKWDVVIPLAIAVILIVYLIISLIVGLFTHKDSGKKDIYSICKLSGKQTYEAILNEDRENPVGVAEYNFYGESLNLYLNSYSLGAGRADTFDGYTIVLRDFCSENEIKYENVSWHVDNQIDLSKLTPGFYRVYAVLGETSHRVYMENKIVYDDVFYTALRDNQSMKVELIANKNLFDEENAEESMLDRNYLYIKVTAVSAEDYPHYDVAISTAPAMSGDVAVSELGEQQNGLVEAQEMYDLAVAVKEKLDAAGIKAVILKEDYNENVLYYGVDGLLDRAYGMNVKYMIHLDMSIDSTLCGVVYSNYVNGNFAQAIFDKLYNGTTLFNAETRLHPSKMVTSTLLGDGLNYDQDWVIREAGGLVLGAGRFSQTSSVNASFAANNVYGIDTVDILLANIRNKDSVNLWKENKDKAASSIAEAIIEYLK